MSQLELCFEKITTSEEHCKITFNLLSKRLHVISHKKTSYSEHKKFLFSHPYRTWYLIKINDQYVGSFYVSKENTIGINTSEKYANFVVKKIIKFVIKNYEPLPEVPSVRNGKFSINVSPTDKLLAEILENIGANVAQISYYLPD